MTSRRDAGSDGLTRGGTLTRNIVINMLGQGVPILAAVAATPVLLIQLGAERFGVLTLAWIVMLHLGLLDLGLGRATTRAVAAYVERRAARALPRLVWTSLLLHACLGVIGGVVLAVLTPWLTETALKVPGDLLLETERCFYLLALSVPLGILSVALRAILEALQRFDLVNAIRTPAAALNFAGPVAVLWVTDSLPVVVAFLVVLRLVTLVANAYACRRALPVPLSTPRISRGNLLYLLRFGGWLTLSSLILPVLISLDRLVIAAVLSLSELTVYATPHEVLTKLTILPAALLAVLFPAFSALSVRGGLGARLLYERACRVLILLVVPLGLVLLGLADVLMRLWLPDGIAASSATISRWLTLGVLVNVLAHVPLTVLHGLGRADVGAKVQLIQLPPYAALLWWACTAHGLLGVSIVWSARALVEAVVLLWLAHRLLPGGHAGHAVGVLPAATWAAIGTALAASALLGTFGSPPVVTVALVSVLLMTFATWGGSNLLTPTERAELRRRFDVTRSGHRRRQRELTRHRVDRSAQCEGRVACSSTSSPTSGEIDSKAASTYW